ncbi:hypothetical protein [Enemella sp. A6]|uniref:hypothetical protein n=1 Tax=Enemella sp. A6 TaxID=3440152 RepID=UPI003EBB26E0
MSRWRLTRSSCRPQAGVRAVQLLVAVVIAAFAVTMVPSSPVLAAVAGLGAVWVLFGAITGRCPGLTRES